jgi:hypothetical protein
MPSTSARKSASKPASSSTRARPTQCSTSVYRNPWSLGWRHSPADWWPAQFMAKALRWIGRGWAGTDSRILQVDEQHDHHPERAGRAVALAAATGTLVFRDR